MGQQLHLSGILKPVRKVMVVGEGWFGLPLPVKFIGR